MVTELKKVEVNPPETGEWWVGTAAEPWPFKQKKRSVKKLNFRYITRSFSIFRRRRPPPATAGNFQVDKGESCFMTVSPFKKVDGGLQEDFLCSAVFHRRAPPPSPGNFRTK